MKTKRCFSKCRKVPEDSCKEKTRLCTFINGKTRKYCRISKYYTLDKDCNMTKKKKKMTQKEASEKITRFFKQNRTRKEPLRRRLSSKEASEKITRFFKKTGPKRKARFLKTICSDSGVCITFGTEINKINEFFHHFIHFDDAVSIKKIGSESANGFVKEIKYEREGYDCYAVLKSSAKQNADNLMYEYEVGQFINKQNKRFPCFLETYGLFLYTNEDAWNHSKQVDTITSDVLRDSLSVLKKIDYSTGCPESKHIALLTQHVKHAKSMLTYLMDTMDKTIHGEKKVSYVMNYEMLYLLYQVYFPLSTLENQFTHYDLHLENVLLYEPSRTSYVTYHYHLKNGRVVHFKSRYIVKIIDYGRSYYNDGEHNSKKTYEAICNVSSCQPKCGFNYGLEVLNTKPGSNFKSNYILSQMKNVSHDLRLISMIKDIFFSRELKKYLKPDFAILLQKVVFKKVYGTKEIAQSGLPNKINHISDACTSLEEMILKSDSTFQNDLLYSTMKSMGEFHIYQDERPMSFTSAQ